MLSRSQVKPAARKARDPKENWPLRNLCRGSVWAIENRRDIANSGLNPLVHNPNSVKSKPIRSFNVAETPNCSLSSATSRGIFSSNGSSSSSLSADPT